MTPTTERELLTSEYVLRFGLIQSFLMTLERLDRLTELAEGRKKHIEDLQRELIEARR